MIETDADYGHCLLEAVGLAVVPGRAFSLPGHFRLSYAYAEDDLKAGCLRLRNAMQCLVDAV